MELKKRQKEHRKAIEHAGVQAWLHRPARQTLEVVGKEMDRINNLAAHTELVQLSTRLKASLTSSGQLFEQVDHQAASQGPRARKTRSSGQLRLGKVLDKSSYMPTRPHTYTHTYVIPVLSSPTPAPPGTPRSKFAESLPLRALLPHGGSKAPSTVTRISSQTHPILVTVGTFHPGLYHEGIESAIVTRIRLPARPASCGS